MATAPDSESWDSLARLLLRLTFILGYWDISSILFMSAKIFVSMFKPGFLLVSSYAVHWSPLSLVGPYIPY